MKKVLFIILIIICPFLGLSQTDNYTWVIQPKYHTVGDFNDGVTFFECDDGSKGFVDKNGKIIRRWTYVNYVRNFSEGLALVDMYGKVAFIDKTGKFVIPFQYRSANNFSEGLAAVERLDGKTGYINKYGKMVIVLDGYEWFYFDNFHNGLARVSKNGKDGYIDNTGKLVIEPTFYYGGPFYGNLAPVQMEKNGKYGFIDQTGRLVVDFIYDYAYFFQEGLAGVALDGKWGFIDETGEMVIPLKFNQITDDIGFQFRYGFSEGLAAVKSNSNKICFINKHGDVAIASQFDGARHFRSGLAAVKINDKWGFINKKGEFVVEPQFAQGRDFSEGLSAACLERFSNGFIKVNNYYKKVNEVTAIDLLSSNRSISSSYNLRIGVKSPSQIRDKYVYVNGSLQRAIDVVKNDGFDMEIGQDVSLHEGNNTIRIEIINASGTTSKEFAVYVSTSTHTISPSEKRIALVIGISNYRNTSRLRNTINDANAMESKLRQCGFTVIKRTDLQTASEIQNVINDFGAQARNGYDVALFFYAGHGINYNNESWIVPTLASIQCAEQIPNVCANAGWIMDATSGVKNRIVIFDACRNLPGIKDCNNASRDIEGHITPGITSFRKGGGAFVAYACSQGETSGDGPIGGNGIYTGELLKILDKPNMNILDVFSETATNVHNKTNATQNPWNTSAFYGKFIFNRQ